MPTLDPNAWYQITESRVGFTSSLQYDGGALLMAAAKAGSPNQNWQFQPIGNGNYQIRNQESTMFSQLATCYVNAEIDASKTRPCMKDARGDNGEQWQLVDWGDGTFMIKNVGNGTRYNMDCHPGNPLFMNENTAAEPVQPAQHWQAQSLAPVDDAQYSTAVTYLNQPTAAASTAPTTTAIAGAGAAGIGNGQTTAASGNANTAAVLTTTTMMSQIISQITSNGQVVPTTFTSAIAVVTSLAPNSDSNSNTQNGQNGSNGNNGQNGNNSSSSGVAIGVGLGVGLVVSTLAVLAFLMLRRRRAYGNAHGMWRGLPDGADWSQTGSCSHPNLHGGLPRPDHGAVGWSWGWRGRQRGTVSELGERNAIPEKMSAPPRAEMDAGFPAGAYHPSNSTYSDRAAEAKNKANDYYVPPIELSTTEPGMERQVAGASMVDGGLSHDSNSILSPTSAFLQSTKSNPEVDKKQVDELVSPFSPI